MADSVYAMLDERGPLEVAGEDRVAFLQGLVSNDVTKVAPDRAIYAALLTAQGKYLHDFFIVAQGESLYLDAEAARLEDLRRRLALYKLRSKVTLADAGPSHRIAVAFGPGALRALQLPETPGAAHSFAGGVAYVDPRLAALGARPLLPRAGAAEALAQAGLSPATAEDYDRHRLSLGVPDGSRDLEIDKTILLEAGFDELNGVDWQKGCYMGQELTARTKYRALIKKRLFPVRIEGALPAPGTSIYKDGQEVGEVRSGSGSRALAMLLLDAVKVGQKLTAGEVGVLPEIPAWMRLPETAAP